jgi:hypothetical protein
LKVDKKGGRKPQKEEFFKQKYFIENDSNDRLTDGTYNYYEGFCICKRRLDI